MPVTENTVLPSNMGKGGGFNPPTHPLFRVRSKVLDLSLLGFSLGVEERRPDAQFL